MWGWRSNESLYLFKKSFRDSRKIPCLAIDFLSDIQEAKLRERLTRKEYKRLGEDFASRCLFSLSFFYERLNALYSRYGAPHPEFYREMGKRTFYYIGDETIAEHFENWEEFLRKRFN